MLSAGKVSFLKNGRGRELLKVDQFQYQLEQVNQGKMIWKCEQCHVRLHTKQHQIVHCFGKHDHDPPGPGKCEKLSSMARLQLLASQNLPPASLQSSSTNPSNNGNKLHLSMEDSVNSSSIFLHTDSNELNDNENIQNDSSVSNCSVASDFTQHQNLAAAAAAAANANSFLTKMKLAPEYRFVLVKKGSGLEQFLLYDSADDGTRPASTPELPPNQRLLIFSTAHCMQLLDQTEHWLCDCSLQPYSYANQLGPLNVVTILSLGTDKLRPLVYALMSGDCIELYHNLFGRLKLLRPSLSPRSIVIAGARNDLALMMDTFQRVFPGAIENVTLNHHQHCLKLKLQELSPTIGDRYRWDLYYRFRVKMMSALAFVPPEKVPEAFDQLINDRQYRDIELELVSYYEQCWIRGEPMSSEGNGETVRKPPLYPPSSWNCYYAIRNRLPIFRPNLLQAWRDRILLYMTSGISNLHQQRKQQPSKLICKCIDALRLDEKYSFDDDLKPQPTPELMSHNQNGATTITTISSSSSSSTDSEKVAQLLQKLVDSFESDSTNDPDFSLVDYLRRVSFCI